MQVSPGFICDRKTRCKYCFGKPTHIKRVAGLSYHSLDLGRHGSNRAAYDLKNYRLRDDKEYYYDKLMRKNSVRGVASFSTFIIKKQRDQYGILRFIVSCECGLSHWMYPGQSDDDAFLNRKKLISIDHYIPRKFLKGINLGSGYGYTW
jgi:hypothetical protein